MKFLAFLCFSASLAAGVDLQYPPDATIVQTSEIIIDIDQKLPHGDLHTQGKQIFDIELTVAADRTTEPVVRAPIDLTVVFKRLQVELDVNKTRVRFDTADESQVTSDPFVAQMNRLIDRKLLLQYDQDFHLQPIDELEILFTELPTLRTYLPDHIMDELFYHLFVLAGRDLSSGDAVQQEIQVGHMEVGEETSWQLPLELRVTSANHKEVEATFQGGFERKEQAVDQAKLVLGGTVSGKGNWMRRNALLAQMKLHHFYDGYLEIDGEEWPIKMTMTQRVSSKRKSDRT